MPAHPVPPKPIDQDHNKGAVEGDRPTDKQQGNANATALDEDGLPKDRIAIAEGLTDLSPHEAFLAQHEV